MSEGNNPHIIISKIQKSSWRLSKMIELKIYRLNFQVRFFKKWVHCPDPHGSPIFFYSHHFYFRLHFFLQSSFIIICFVFINKFSPNLVKRLFMGLSWLLSKNRKSWTKDLYSDKMLGNRVISGCQNTTAHKFCCKLVVPLRLNFFLVLNLPR